jgi:DNA-binding MarR family transcriptional regulator
MDRDFDPRDHEQERPGIDRGGRGASSRAHDPRNLDPREVFTRELSLPRGAARQRVTVRGEDYFLRGSEVRTLATVGAFRVVPAEDLREASGRRSHAGRGEVYRLREAGLVRTLPLVIGRRRTTLVTLTSRGRELLESRRASGSDVRQAFYDGALKPRELSHDSQAYRAYLDAAERLAASGSRIRRVVLDYELKSQYQRFLQGRNRARRAGQDHLADEHQRRVAEWANEHCLPVEDGHVQFPDVRIEHEQPDGRLEVEDVEVVTPHYRGALAAAKARSGFRCYRAGSLGRVGGRAGRRGAAPPDPRLAEELLS